jgi:2-polyprenyl-3-methyl-5-hydroxy-6-metoxy-1,4-benzoquinol methylase
MPAERPSDSGRTAKVVRDLHEEVADNPNLAVASVRPLGTTQFELWMAGRDVSRKLGVDRGTSVLEIGCGVGVIGLPVARRASRYVGVDMAEAALDVFRRRLAHARLPQSCTGLCALDFVAAPDETICSLGQFDRVLAYSVLHYVGSDAAGRRFVARALAALEPGGRALFGNLPLSDIARELESTPASRRGSFRKAAAMLAGALTRGTPNAVGMVESRRIRLANLVFGGVRSALGPLMPGARFAPRSVPPGSVVDLTTPLVEAWVHEAPVPVRWHWLTPAAMTPLSRGRADLLVIRDD